MEYLIGAAGIVLIIVLYALYRAALVLFAILEDE